MQSALSTGFSTARGMRFVNGRGTSLRESRKTRLFDRDVSAVGRLCVCRLVMMPYPTLLLALRRLRLPQSVAFVSISVVVIIVLATWSAPKFLATNADAPLPLLKVSSSLGRRVVSAPPRVIESRCIERPNTRCRIPSRTGWSRPNDMRVSDLPVVPAFSVWPDPRRAVAALIGLGAPSIASATHRVSDLPVPSILGAKGASQGTVLAQNARALHVRVTEDGVTARRGSAFLAGDSAGLFVDIGATQTTSPSSLLSAVVARSP
mmetsp:Transcript_24239/g.78180  ORF Transcript_24239/g.78180 Transcript_24239/m.78180 type:complete len:263 (-) Transcript_24239:2839-3627(-)